MTPFGKSIRIYLKDGNVTGLKFSEVVNQTIQSIACPRIQVTDLSIYPEANRPGVYFLLGIDEINGEPKAYIGEAENVYNRLLNHLTGKDFWNEVIFFVSKDENLTKSHVKYLEGRLVQIALLAKRYSIENINQPQMSMLPPADKDAMEEFLSYIKLLIGVLGHRLLEEVILPKTLVSQKETSNLDFTATTQKEDSRFDETYFLEVADIKASSAQTNEGFVVFKNSAAAKETTNSLPNGYKDLRNKLINEEILALNGNKYVFKSDILFSSPSQAASVITGYSVSGPAIWKSQSGKSLKDIEKEKVNTHLQD